MDAFSRELNEMLVKTFWSVMKVEEQMLKQDPRLNLSISEFHLIESVGKADERGRTIGDIALDLGIARPPVTVSVNKLQEKGYVDKRRDDKDGRVVYVTLTETGHKINAFHAYFHTQMVREVSGLLANDERDALLRALNKLNVFFDKKVSQRARA